MQEMSKFYLAKAKAGFCFLFFYGKTRELIFVKGQTNFRYCTDIMCSFELQENQEFNDL